MLNDFHISRVARMQCFELLRQSFYMTTLLALLDRQKSWEAIDPGNYVIRFLTQYAPNY